MGKSSKKSGVEVAPAAVPAPLGKSGKKGKRDAEDQIEKAVSAKKQKAEVPKLVPQKEVAKKAKKQPPPKKVESSSSEEDSSESEEEVKVQPKKTVKKPVKQEPSDSSEDSSDEEPAKKPAASAKKLPATHVANGSKKSKQESSSEEEESDEDDKPAAPAKKPSNAASQKKVEEAESSESDSDESESDEDVPAKATAAAKKKEESIESSDSDSDSEDEPAKPSAAKRPLVTDKTAVEQKGTSKKEDEDSEDTSDESDEEPPQKKLKDAAPKSAAKPAVAKAAKKESSSDEEDDSSEESSDDDEAKQAQGKKETPVENAATKQTATKSEKKEPKTPVSNQSQASGSKTLFVGNLPFKAEADHVKEYFQEAGEVVDVRFAAHDDGTPKGFAHVEFSTAEAAQKALEFNGSELMGRALRLDLAHERGAYTPRSRNDNDSSQKPARSAGKTLFIKGFDSSLDEDEIRSSLEEHFGSCGEITRVSIPKDYDTGASKGIAYMDFTDQSSFSKALELNGSELGGYNLVVDEAKPRTDKREGGGWGSGTGGRFERGRGRGFGRDGGRGGRRGRGNGRGDRGRGGNRQSFGTHSSGKKTKFGDED